MIVREKDTGAGGRIPLGLDLAKCSGDDGKARLGTWGRSLNERWMGLNWREWRVQSLHSLPPTAMADVHISSPAHSTSSPPEPTHNDDDNEGNEAGPSSYRPSLAELSRNASVISSTSSESEFEPPERPPRTAQAPSALRLGPTGNSTNSTQATRSTSPAHPSQSQLPAEPPTPRAKRAPGSSTNPEELQLRTAEPGSPVRSRAPSRQRGQRSSSRHRTLRLGMSSARAPTRLCVPRPLLPLLSRVCVGAVLLIQNSTGHAGHTSLHRCRVCRKGSRQGPSQAQQ
jgi:hypothetical protein